MLFIPYRLSFYVYWKPLLVAQYFLVYRSGKVPLATQFPAFVPPRAIHVQPSGCPLNVFDRREKIAHRTLHGWQRTEELQVSVLLDPVSSSLPCGRDEAWVYNVGHRSCAQSLQPPLWQAPKAFRQELDAEHCANHRLGAVSAVIPCYWGLSLSLLLLSKLLPGASVPLNQNLFPFMPPSSVSLICGHCGQESQNTLNYDTSNPWITQSQSLAICNQFTDSVYNLRSLPVNTRCFVLEIFHKQVVWDHRTLSLSLPKLPLTSQFAPRQNLSLSMNLF